MKFPDEWLYRLEPILDHICQFRKSTKDFIDIENIEDIEDIESIQKILENYLVK